MNITKAIFYKEWIKMRGVIIGVAALFLAMVPYLLVNIDSKFRFAGKAHLWSVIAEKDINLIGQMHYLPLIAGIVIGLFQFVPEMNKRSLKLTLHLPYPEKLTILKMMLFGSTTLLATFVISNVILFCLLSLSLPSAVLYAWFMASLPWYLSGIIAYFLACWVCIEPSWKQRAINTLVSASLISIFIKGTGSFGYMYFIPILVVICLLAMLFPFYSIFRFKDGVPE